MTFKPGKNAKVVTSAKALERLTEPGRYRDHEVRGLHLQITNAANRSWVLRYQMDKRPRQMGLGAYPEVTLSKARAEARAVRERIRAGHDPLAERTALRASRAAAAQQKIMTFQQAADAFYAARSSEWKTDKQRVAFRNSMRDYVFPVIGKLDVAAVDLPAVLRVLQPIWKTKPSVANLLRIRLETILTHAQVSGYRSGDNPARWSGNLAVVLPSHAKTQKVEHHAALPYQQIPTFMAKLHAQDSLASKALQFIILSGCRIQEALGATWGEIDLQTRLWTIPAERMKAGREHVVPLSDAAVAVLEALPREDGNVHVFVGRAASSALSELPLRLLLKTLLGEDESATVHGFRSAFRDWCGDETDHALEVAKAAIAHKVGDASEQAYRRGTAIEKRRRLMQAWADFCCGEERGVVVPMRR